MVPLSALDAHFEGQHLFKVKGLQSLSLLDPSPQIANEALASQRCATRSCVDPPPRDLSSVTGAVQHAAPNPICST
jgi:hypothetical protein